MRYQASTVLEENQVLNEQKLLFKKTIADLSEVDKNAVWIKCILRLLGINCILTNIKLILCPLVEFHRRWWMVNVVCYSVSYIHFPMVNIVRIVCWCDGMAIKSLQRRKSSFFNVFFINFILFPGVQCLDADTWRRDQATHTRTGHSGERTLTHKQHHHHVGRQNRTNDRRTRKTESEMR